MLRRPPSRSRCRELAPGAKWRTSPPNRPLRRCRLPRESPHPAGIASARVRPCPAGRRRPSFDTKTSSAQRPRDGAVGRHRTNDAGERRWRASCPRGSGSTTRGGGRHRTATPPECCVWCPWACRRSLWAPRPSTACCAPAPVPCQGNRQRGCDRRSASASTRRCRGHLRCLCLGRPLRRTPPRPRERPRRRCRNRHPIAVASVAAPGTPGDEPCRSGGRRKRRWPLARRPPRARPWGAHGSANPLRMRVVPAL
mmetsp:Transcript_88702/g.248175  ORF Transcript_88702/g.248175 Transcript_88702/m.248175 type:complete len:254 (+) Transcript_88702:277-1038(+)